MPKNNCRIKFCMTWMLNKHKISRFMSKKLKL